MSGHLLPWNRSIGVDQRNGVRPDLVCLYIYIYIYIYTYLGATKTF